MSFDEQTRGSNGAPATGILECLPEAEPTLMIDPGVHAPKSGRLRAFRLALGSHIPPGQLGRYLLVGSWNTVFGYLSYAALTAVLSPAIPYAYVVASLLASFVNITLAFLLHKHFVFKTKGNYLREWARCLVVYSSGTAMNLALLPVIVQLISRWTRYAHQAPYLAGALLTGLAVTYNFFGHKKFSFQVRP